MSMLTISDAVTLGSILQSCQQNHPCTWMVPGNGGHTVTGTMRAIVKDTEHAALMTHDVDVRDGYVWISATFEHFLPVRDVITWVQEGAFALNYR